MTDIDFDPLKTSLDDLSHVHKYNEMIYEGIRPFLGKRILEVGAGIGNISALLNTSDKELLMLTDYKDEFVFKLNNKFSHDSRIKVIKFDISSEVNIDTPCAIDSIVCVNVLEHIKDDVAALVNCKNLLIPGGKIILFVPALQILYGSLDESFGHYRRYNKKELNKKLTQAGFNVVSSRYFNMIGVLGWLLSAKILKRGLIPTSHLKLFELITFIVRLEKYIHPPFGLSILAVGEKFHENALLRTRSTR